VKVGGGSGNGSRNSGESARRHRQRSEGERPGRHRCRRRSEGRCGPDRPHQREQQADALDDSNLSPDAVLAKIQSQYMAGLKHCYKEYLKKDASARGKVVLDLTVNESGRTVDGRASNFSADEVNSCITALMSSCASRFPKKDNEATSASFRHRAATRARVRRSGCGAR